ncbi:MAG: hypothetical protein KAQ99_01570 [Candidatus Aureabacteria bacterium]|nr:hypothetical protein [Candidatus Auribacterota bacterium]
MVKIFCLVCADIKDIDLFKTAVKPPYDRNWIIYEIDNPSKTENAPTAHYRSYFQDGLGLGVCIGCADSIKLMQEADKIAGHKVMNLDK